MIDRPAPLTPPNCDLQDFPFMPLHVARLRDSDLAAEGHPEACWYAVLLWSASWHQLPAGSLPAADAVLARLCGLGRDLKTFRKHRADVLRGWIECDDGRLYHPVVAEQVISGWDRKRRQRHRTLCAAVRKHNERKPDEKRDSPDFEAWLSLECPGDVASLVTAMSRVTDPIVTRETASKRQGQGQGDYNTVAKATAAEAAAPPDSPDVAKAAEAHLWDAGKRFLQTRGVAKAQAGSVIGKWKGAHGTASVLEALGVAQREPDLVDPIPFIEKILRRRAGTEVGANTIGGVRMSSPC
ncbi:YdaU family protein [Sphingomonas hylomeconis]|uniref:YdaU family protein n=1 Tax=Sphingomonas hylomeconis TaxID=1395958 RepID=A0ABV7SQG5_9SPHN|nr:YdaU family protein [Sphingomonas hylomeconis]